ncbi:putative carbonyl reductase [Polyplosphaeria fusca]|uniref:Carbonyl reductase n=1 Tax=Polyplosphaeria fusca TaxID=682080 RepID=A0A9P4V134_9PLEO|nr:putative carbonyl reductase [Polyplosphaeria fusca]
MASNKTIALVTGANRGIGLELARTLARDHGFHVLLGSRSQQSGVSAVKTLKDEGLSVEGITVDLGSDDTIIAAAKEVEQKYGKLDVLVNNAAINLDHTWSGKPDDVRRVYKELYETNLFGTVTVTEAFLPLLGKAKIPRVVFLTSTLGSLTERADPKSAFDSVPGPAYRTSKAAVNMLTLHYAWQFRDDKTEGKKWKVNMVCPGFVKTDMNDNTGTLSTAESMPNIVRLCTLGEDGPSGTYTGFTGPVDW